MNILANEIIKEAKQWTTCVEDKGTPNRSVCVDKIHVYSGGKVNNDPWCAKFTWMVLDKACNKSAIRNIIPPTASTHTLRRFCKEKGIAVNKKAEVGSIMFFSTGTNTGHVGFVVETKPTEFITIEGNSGDRVAWRKHKYTEKNFDFLHVQKMPGWNADAPMLASISMPVGIGLGAAALLSYWYAKKSKWL